MLTAFTLLLVTSLYNTSGNRCFQPSLFQRVALVHLKGGSIVKSLTRDVPLGCQSACIQTTGCKSINMRKRSDEYFDCDLLSENKDTSGRELKPLKDSTYYEVRVSVFDEMITHRRRKVIIILGETDNGADGR